MIKGVLFVIPTMIIVSLKFTNWIEVTIISQKLWSEFYIYISGKDIVHQSAACNADTIEDHIMDILPVSITYKGTGHSVPPILQHIALSTAHLLYINLAKHF